jgi:hypothetical protein
VDLLDGAKIIFNFTRINLLKNRSAMNTKLTLTIDKSVIYRAKKYAKEKENSLSDIVENYLKVITSEQSKPDIEITPMVKSLMGSFKAPKNFDYKKELSKGLSEKYL